MRNHCHRTSRILFAICQQYDNHNDKQSNDSGDDSDSDSCSKEAAEGNIKSSVTLNVVMKYGMLLVLILALKILSLAFNWQMNTDSLFVLILNLEETTMFSILELTDSHQ